MWLDSWPGLGLSSVTEQVHDDGTLGDGLINLEQVLSWNPTILFGLLPGCAVLPHTDDNIHAVVSEIETLAVTLGAITDEGKGIVLEVFLFTISFCSNGQFILHSRGASQEASPIALLAVRKCCNSGTAN